ncbi:hypothetical protein ACHAXS_003467 [Conticribra weissflogii]
MVLKTILIPKSSCRQLKPLNASETTPEKIHQITNRRYSSSRTARQNRSGVVTVRQDPPAIASINAHQQTSCLRSRSEERRCRRLPPFPRKHHSYHAPSFYSRQKKVHVEGCESASSPIYSGLANDFNGRKNRSFTVFEDNTTAPAAPLVVFDSEISDCMQAHKSIMAMSVRGGQGNNIPSRYSTVDQFDLEVMPVPLTNTSIPLHQEYHRRSRSVAHPNYDVGQEGHTIDVNVEANEESAKFATSLLRQFDACFVKRSDGRWSYAILVERYLNEEEVEKSSLTFVVDESGSTKTISWHKWGQYVRLVREPIEGSVLFNKLKARVFGEDVKIVKRGLKTRLSGKKSRSTTALGGMDGFDPSDPRTW